MTTNRIKMLPVALIGAALLTGLYACGGDTDGGAGSGDAAIVDGPVSDGGFGASLEITLSSGGNEIGVGDREHFFVDALDPQGLPLAHQRVFCSTEGELVLVEPTTEFEHTNSRGRMSGILGCMREGSFMVECRLEQGFNLKAQKHIQCQGDGTALYPGAVGGSLGGGVAGDAVTISAAEDTAATTTDDASLGQSN